MEWLNIQDQLKMEYHHLMIFLESFKMLEDLYYLKKNWKNIELKKKREMQLLKEIKKLKRKEQKKLFLFQNQFNKLTIIGIL